MQDFNDKLQRCIDCDESWFKKNTLNMWYDRLLYWVQQGECFLEDDGLETMDRHIPPESFYVCLRTYMETDEGEDLKDVIRFSNATEISD